MAQQQSIVEGRLTVGLSYEYEYYDHALSGSDPAPNPKSELTQFRTTQLEIGYGLSNRLRLHAWVPYRQITSPKTHDPGGPQEKRITRHFSGLGDIVAMGSYQVLQPQAQRQPSLILGIGLRMPTGSSQPDHDWGTGIWRDPVLQTGFGSLDPILGVASSVSLGRWHAYTSGAARWTTERNIHGYRFGDEYQATLGGGLTLSEWMDVSLSATAITAGHDDDATSGGKVGNTGGQWFYLTPGITLHSGAVNAEISLQLPIHEDVNTTSAAYGQLVSDYVFRISLSCGFSTRGSTLPIRKSGESGRFSHPADADIETISIGESVELAEHLATGKYTVFEFYGDRCLSCQAVEPELRAILRSRDDVALRKVNIGLGDTPVMSQYQITETPTFILFDRSGQQVLRYAGTEVQEIMRLLGE